MSARLVPERMTVKELRKLVSEMAADANIKLRELRETGANKLSLEYRIKWAPYLQRYGTKRDKLFRRDTSKDTKKVLLEKYYNLQRFNKMPSPEQIKRDAAKNARRSGIFGGDTGDLTQEEIEYWAKIIELMKYGYQSLSFKVDSETMEKIIEERLDKGQTPEEIKAAIDNASYLALDSDEWLDFFSEGGEWL